MKTIAISSTQAKSNGILQQVNRDTINELIEFYHKKTIDYQFAPVLNYEWLNNLQGIHGLSLDDFYVVRKQGLIVGCLAIWDQRAFKQTVVKGYSFPLNKLRFLYNIFAIISKKTALPKVNVRIEEIYISFIAFDESNKSLIIEAIQDALYKIKKRGSTLAIMGLSSQNAITHLIESNFKTHIYESCIEAVQFNAKVKLPLDNKVVQPEVALL
jgi:hypothetical protein